MVQMNRAPDGATLSITSGKHGHEPQHSKQNSNEMTAFYRLSNMLYIRKMESLFLKRNIDSNVQQNFVLPVEGTMDIKILEQEKTLQCCIMSLRVLRLSSQTINDHFFIDVFCNIIEMGVEKGIQFKCSSLSYV
ncbi:hypothetical protein T08_10667 [Trichinella sp. T8]|nr:hypothetical protein T08_10667 [Trichinella sp. T8]